MHNYKDEKYFPSYIIGLSILIVGVLVSASFFYNTKLILQKLGGETENPSQQQVNNNGTDGPVVNVPVRADAPSLGNKNAKITLVEFSDFQCPYCKSYFSKSFADIKKNYIDTGKVRLIFRNMPLPFHANAQKAAEAGECANRQGKFWEYHQVLFTKGQSDGSGLEVASLKTYAADLGLNTQIFNRCLDNSETAEVIKKDLADAQTAGVDGTPTFFINGKKTVGAVPFANFEVIFKDILK